MKSDRQRERGYASAPMQKQERDCASSAADPHA